MSRRKQGDSSPSPEELLAAYAAGALDGEEANAVEEHMAAHPEARAEMESLRDAIVAARRTRPVPEREPDWKEMALAIAAQCEPPAAGARKPESTLGRLWRLLRRPRVAVASAVAAAAAIALAWTSLGPEGALRETTSAPREAVAVTATRADAGPTTELRAPEVDELDEAELQALLEELTPAALRDIESDDSLLSEETAADWIGLDREESSTVDPVYATGFGLDVFAEPDYESWLDDLAEAEIEAVAEYLERAEAG